jgi:hypothetical protein
MLEIIENLKKTKESSDLFLTEIIDKRQQKPIQNDKKN